MSRPRTKRPRTQRPRTQRPRPKRLFAFNKPFGVLCQFSDGGERETLADYVDVPHVYPAGRLDRDSEGLLLLTGDGTLQSRISEPRHKLDKTYWVQVEGVVSAEAVEKLRTGVTLRDGPTAPAKVEVIEPPSVWERTPPIRQRKNSPTSWLALTIHEGRNRQVRRMTAAVGFPTLRLIRCRIGPWALDGLRPGELREIEFPQPWLARR